MTIQEQQIIECGYAVMTLSSAAVMDNPVAVKYAVIAVCLGGHARVEVNGRGYDIVPGTRACFSQVMTLRRLSHSDDFDAVVLLMDERFVFNCTVGVEVNLIHALFTLPVHDVGDGVTRMVLSLMQALQAYQEMPQTTHSIDVSGSLVRSILIILAEDMRRRVKPDAALERYTMADTYLRDFVTLVRLNIKREHEVAYYADQLHITPKYLNDVCKRKTGHKAKEIISALLLQQLKVAILLSGKSVKEIAYEYGFADQSSMGKFFRKLTGQSPAAFRQQ